MDDLKKNNSSKQDVYQALFKCGWHTRMFIKCMLLILMYFYAFAAILSLKLEKRN